MTHAQRLGQGLAVGRQLPGVAHPPPSLQREGAERIARSGGRRVVGLGAGWLAVAQHACRCVEVLGGWRGGWREQAAEGFESGGDARSVYGVVWCGGAPCPAPATSSVCARKHTHTRGACMCVYALVLACMHEMEGANQHQRFTAGLLPNKYNTSATALLPGWDGTLCKHAPMARPPARGAAHAMRLQPPGRTWPGQGQGQGQGTGRGM